MSGLRSSNPSQAALRLMSDLREIKTEPPEVVIQKISHDGFKGVSASPVNDENLFVWNASIMGPDDTPWEGERMSLFSTTFRRYIFP